MVEYIKPEKDRYIKLSQALEVLDSCACWWAHDRMELIHAADVRPVVRGKWKLSDDRFWHTCSICGADIDVSVGLLCYVDNEEVCNHNFCPNCGAMMVEES